MSVWGFFALSPHSGQDLGAGTPTWLSPLPATPSTSESTVTLDVPVHPSSLFRHRIKCLSRSLLACLITFSRHHQLPAIVHTRRSRWLGTSPPPVAFSPSRRWRGHGCPGREGSCRPGQTGVEVAKAVFPYSFPPPHHHGC